MLSTALRTSSVQVMATPETQRFQRNDDAGVDPNHFYDAAAPSRPSPAPVAAPGTLRAPEIRPEVSVLRLERYTVLLQDHRTRATVYPVSSLSQLPLDLLMFLCDELNLEIERGTTSPLYDPLDLETFQQYWFGSVAGIMLLGDSPEIENRLQWEKACLGTFYIKPNYPGRSSNVCTGEFLVNRGIRGKGIGKTMVDCFLEWASKIGYSLCVFNLVYETNLAMRKICDDMGFSRVGRLKGAGILKDNPTPVAVLIFSKEIVPAVEVDVTDRFTQIQYYLETGNYPSLLSKAEKSRLRSASSRYQLEDGQLKFKGRVVISDPTRQVEIVKEIHGQNHMGINKTTSAIAKKYHWTQIKQTVIEVVKSCRGCTEWEHERPNSPNEQAGIGAPTHLLQLPQDTEESMLRAVSQRLYSEQDMLEGPRASGVARTYSEYRQEFDGSLPGDPDDPRFNHSQGVSEPGMDRSGSRDPMF